MTFTLVFQSTGFQLEILFVVCVSNEYRNKFYTELLSVEQRFTCTCLSYKANATFELFAILTEILIQSVNQILVLLAAQVTFTNPLFFKIKLDN